MEKSEGKQSPEILNERLLKDLQQAVLLNKRFTPYYPDTLAIQALSVRLDQWQKEVAAADYKEVVMMAAQLLTLAGTLQKN